LIPLGAKLLGHYDAPRWGEQIMEQCPKDTLWLRTGW